MRRSTPRFPRIASARCCAIARASSGSARGVKASRGTTPRRGPFERFTNAEGLPNGPIRTIAFAADGAVWTGSAFGMAGIDPATRAIAAFHHDANDARSLSGTAVESIVIAPDGQLWVGTDDGLNR